MKRTVIRWIGWVRKIAREKFHYTNENFPYYISIATAFVLFLIALNAFVELTDDLAENDLHAFDTRITAFIQQFRHDTLTVFFVFITHLGDRIGYLIITALLALFFFIRERNWKFILQTTLVLLLSTASNILLKKAINRARPAAEHLVTVSTLSYPSGHAMCAMAFYGFLLYLTLRYRIPKAGKILLVAVLALLILSIGISRIYLGVHYPSDVIAGFIGGLIWVTFCIAVFNIVDLLRQRRKRKAISAQPVDTA